MWRRPTCLGRSAGLDAGGGVRGDRVCRARTSEREDEAGALQVTVERGHMLVSEAAARAAFTAAFVLSAKGEKEEEEKEEASASTSSTSPNSVES